MNDVILRPHILNFICNSFKILNMSLSFKSKERRATLNCHHGCKTVAAQGTEWPFWPPQPLCNLDVHHAGPKETRSKCSFCPCLHHGVHRKKLYWVFSFFFRDGFVSISKNIYLYMIVKRFIHSIH